jgi:oxaloacetate decarboxylase alpha subunit
MATSHTRKSRPQTSPDAKPAAAAAPKPRLRITDTTLRDAHQSLWATRMRSADILGIIDTIDAAGYYSLECWGGATFDVCLRFLRENPWERLRQIKARCPKTPLQMLLRGQNILGYRNYPDDVLERFIELAASNGIDIFRIFDALNDNRNLERAIRAVKACGAHAQGTISYTVSPVHTVEAYVRIAREQEAMGADSICIKDMAGILAPAAAERLVKALTAELRVPVQLHSHMTSGMAVATYLEGVRAGAGAIDCAVATMSGYSSQPPTETLQAIAEDAGYDTGLDLAAVERTNEYFRKLKPSREPSHHPTEIVDVDVLEHHIPGGMISNLRSQLQQQDALDRIAEVLDELPRVRADMGYPPLVTPTSQIVGVQAVLNVIAGERYAMVPQETRDYVKGLYGRSPAPIDAALVRKILGEETPVSVRPADLLSPGLPAAASLLDPNLVQAEEDILSYCLFPEVAQGYFKWRALPEAERPPSPADAERAAEEAPAPAAPAAPEAGGDASHAGHAEIGRIVAQLVQRLGFTAVAGPETAAAAAHPPTRIVPPPVQAAPAPRPAAAEKPAAPSGPTIDAPLNGTFYRTPAPGKPNFAEEGATVRAGDPVCVVEAMKLFNQIKAPRNARLVRFLVAHGAHVSKGQPLASYEPA